MPMISPLKLYFLVMYNLSGIQKGIQAGHSGLEYAKKYGDTPLYKEFIDNHKTFILLDGGGSEDMEQYLKYIESLGVNYAEFREPDLNNSVSAIAFIVSDEERESPDSKIGLFLSHFNFARN